MSFIIAEKTALYGLITVDSQPGNSGSARNKASQPMAFQASAKGHWLGQNDRGSSHKAISKMVTDEFGAAPERSNFLYQSQEFDNADADIAFLQETIEKYEALGQFVDFVRFPAFITMNDQRMTTPVPSYVPNHQTPILDGEGNPTGDFDPVLWQDWKDANHKHISGNNVNIIFTNANTGGQDLAGTILVMLLNDSAPYNVQPTKDLPAQETLDAARN